MKSSIISKKYFKNGKLLTGFTLIELVVAIAITTVLSGVILFSITQYISKGKDSNIFGNLVILIPAGEVYYNANGNSYDGFCSSSIVNNTKAQMPVNSSGNCYDTLNPSGVCCNDVTSFSDAWAACAQEFTNPLMAYCVDSRGVKKEIDTTSCDNDITQCP